MIHVVHQIERHFARPSGTGRIVARAALLSAMLLLLGIGGLLSSRANAQDVTQDFDPAREAQTMLDALDAGDFAAVHARFDATMAAAVSAEQLKQGIGSLATQVGTLQTRGEPDVKTSDTGALVKVPLRYERGELTAIIAFDNERKVSGFAIRPVQAAKPATVAPAVPEDANYRETEVLVGEGANALPATLAMPNGNGPFSAVVLVHGSGPQDRDSTIGPNRPLLDIARGLAERGVAVLRYEKRTRAHPHQFADSGTIDLETTDDAVTAASLLRGLPDIDAKRVFVFGHSQGAMMAPRIGARDPQIAGLILLAAPSRPLLDILIEQNRRLAILNDGTVSDAENTAIQRLADSVNAIRKGREMTAAQSPMGLPPAYWRSVEAVDPVAEAKAIAQPMLVLQGARDIQVVDADWQGWKAAFHDTPRVTFKLYETLNHLGIPGEGDGNLQEYQTPGHVSPELIADVAAWIAAQPSK
ncbi:MAG: alpha/beta fold hydrolase [Pseudomonadota bacterium]